MNDERFYNHANSISALVGKMNVLESSRDILTLVFHLQCEILDLKEEIDILKASQKNHSVNGDEENSL